MKLNDDFFIIFYCFFFWNMLMSIAICIQMLKSLLYFVYERRGLEFM